MRGDGRIFQVRKKDGTLLSRYWWIAYYLRGEEFRESTGTKDRDAAERFLRRRLKEVGSAQLGHSTFVGPKGERTTVNTILDNLVADKRQRGKKDPSSDIRPLRKKFGDLPASRVTAAQVANWVEELQKEGRNGNPYKPATINRYLQLFGQAYELAMQRRELATKPYMPHLDESSNVRQGKFSITEFERVVMLLPDYLQDFFRWSYVTGWRRGAIRSLRWSEIEGDTILVRPQYSKDRKMQRIPLVGPLREIIERCRLARKGDYVFHYDDGRPIGDYKTAWKTARREAGMEGKLFHDFRRTAATNLRRSGVPENVAMQITGHKTRSMYARYDIREDRDVRQAIVQREQWEVLERQRELDEAARPAATTRLQ
jgi:integrase